MKQHVSLRLGADAGAWGGTRGTASTDTGALLTPQRVLVTATGGGIGKPIAQAFADAGARVHPWFIDDSFSALTGRVTLSVDLARAPPITARWFGGPGN